MSRIGNMLDRQQAGHAWFEDQRLLVIQFQQNSLPQSSDRGDLSAAESAANLADRGGDLDRLER